MVSIPSLAISWGVVEAFNKKVGVSSFYTPIPITRNRMQHARFHYDLSCYLNKAIAVDTVCRYSSTSCERSVVPSALLAI